MTYTLPLQQIDRSTIPLAGGKGANLGELVSAGFPVPQGFVLTTNAYTAFVAENGLQTRINELAATIESAAPQAAEEAFERLRGHFVSGDIPAGIRSELLTAFAELTATGRKAVAVRSSATAEDLPAASFAGQQESYLNIQDEEALLAAVRNCWASLWTPRAVAYRSRQAIASATISLAVVVQQLVPADAAGVLFTANPVSGARDEIVINAAWGLGEALVGGQVTPDTLTLSRPSGQILARETTTKQTMTVRTATGTTAQAVPVAQQDRPVIDDATATELARLGTAIEAHFQRPLDIEWAIADGAIAILQARPITNLPPAPLRDVRWEPPRPGTVWMRRQVVEHMPEPLSPLFAELYLRDGLDHSLQSLTEFMSDRSGIPIDLWAFLDPPFATTVNGYAYTIASFNFDWRMVPLALRVYIFVLPSMLRHLLPRWRDESLPAYRTAIARWQQLDLAQAADEELLAGMRDLAAQDAIYWFAAAVPLGLARLSDALLDRFLKSTTGGHRSLPGRRLTSGSFLRGFPSPAAEAQAQLEAIARKIHTVAGLPAQVSQTPARGLPALLQGHPDIMADLHAYLDAYGHQIYNLDFAAPTLADEPLPVLLSLQSAVAQPERDSRVRQAEIIAERERVALRMEEALNPLQRPLFRALLRLAQRFAPYREMALFYVGAAWPALRRLAFELGRRLTDAGSLHAAGDLFFLESPELAAAGAARSQGQSRPDLAQLAQERRRLREARQRLDPPVSVPPDGRLKFGPIDMAFFEPKPRGVSSGPVLDGFAVSPGKVTAPASVIRSPDEFDQMAPDSILVCTATTPAWTPLFAQAKGLVTDIGGALAHGSIVAREYDIPAVMGTGVATQRITSGQLLRIDGDRGTVTLLAEVDDSVSPEPGPPAGAARSRAWALLFLGGALLLLYSWWRKRRGRAEPAA